MLLLIKAIHIITAILWVGALFAMGRTMLAHRNIEDSDHSSALRDQLGRLEKSIYQSFANPFMMLVFVAGIVMIGMHSGYMKNGWMHIKLLLLIFLLVQHILMKGQMSKMDTDKMPSAKRLKSNILILVILFSAIVFLAVFKTNMDWILFGALLIVELILGLWFIQKK